MEKCQISRKCMILWKIYEGIFRHLGTAAVILEDKAIHGGLEIVVHDMIYIWLETGFRVCLL